MGTHGANHCTRSANEIAENEIASVVSEGLPAIPYPQPSVPFDGSFRHLKTLQFKGRGLAQVPELCHQAWTTEHRGDRGAAARKRTRWKATGERGEDPRGVASGRCERHKVPHLHRRDFFFEAVRGNPNHDGAHVEITCTTSCLIRTCLINNPPGGPMGWVLHLRHLRVYR